MSEGAQDSPVARLGSLDIFWRDGGFVAGGQDVPVANVRSWTRAGLLQWFVGDDERLYMLRSGILRARIRITPEPVWYGLVYLAVVVLGSSVIALVSPEVFDGTPYALAATVFVWLAPLALIWYVIVTVLCARARGIDDPVNGTTLLCFFSPFAATLSTMTFSHYTKGDFAIALASGGVEAARAALLPVTAALWVLAFGIAAVARPWLPGDPLITPVTPAEARRRTATLWLLAVCGCFAVSGYLVLAALGRFPA